MPHAIFHHPSLDSIFHSSRGSFFLKESGKNAITSDFSGYNMSIESCRNIVLIETWEDWISAHLRKQDPAAFVHKNRRKEVWRVIL